MRRRLTPIEMEQALAFKVAVTRNGCQIHSDASECDGEVQAAHVIPKQALRRRHLDEYVYDPRNGIGACYKAHRRSDAGLKRFPAEKLSAEFWQFAEEVELAWLAEKLYVQGGRRAPAGLSTGRAHDGTREVTAP